MYTYTETIGAGILCFQVSLYSAIVREKLWVEIVTEPLLRAVSNSCLKIDGKYRFSDAVV